jgi:hydroxypyruvate isomerase
MATSFPADPSSHAPALTTNSRARYLVNCSMMFTELPLLERPWAAREAGFDAIEFWWPFADPVPADAEVADFIRSIVDAGVQLVGLNFFAGDLGGSDCGVLSIPARSQEFRDNIDVALGIAEQLGVSVLNALYGNRVTAVSVTAQEHLAVQNLVRAAAAASTIDATVLVEPVSGPKPYPLRTAADAMAAVTAARAAGADNIGLLCDLYHLAANGDDLELAISTHSADIAHVQIADFPGRGEPGSGSLDLTGRLLDLQCSGYTGWVSLEYRPTTTTLDSLRWLPRSCRAGTPGRGGGDR